MADKMLKIELKKSLIGRGAKQIATAEALCLLYTSQKVNPHGLRVGVIKDWDSRWFASKKDFSENLVEDHKIRTELKDVYKRQIWNCPLCRSAVMAAACTCWGKMCIRDRSTALTASLA